MSILRFENADIYQKENLILKDVSFNINEGEFVYLLGRTGGGKSSLLKTIYGDLWLKRGIAEVLGYPLHRLKKSQIPFLRRKIGVVFQDFQLFTDRNIFHNLQFVLQATGWKDKQQIQNRIEEVLRQVQLENVHQKMPHQLSGGEQQRVVIARALLNNPQLLVADEPTGNLDPVVSVEILKLFKHINQQGTTVLMATHNLELVQQFSARMLFCDGNQVKEM